MRLARYGEPGTERPAMLDGEGRLRDLSDVVGDIDGAALAPAGLGRLRALDPSDLPPVKGEHRLGPPVARPGKLIGIGRNHSDHAAEAGMLVPPEPVVFLEATSANSGPDDDVSLPPGADRTDWEVELAFVIGARARRLTEARAMDHVAGYCILNDVSERGWQLERAGQWTKGKSHDTFAPMGPWLVTADAVPNPQALALRLDVNGARRQDGTTATMIFGVAHLVSYLSRFMTLEPGDVVTTGTPPGVGPGMTPPTFLAPGDRMRLEIEGLGVQEQRVVADGPA